MKYYELDGTQIKGLKIVIFDESGKGFIEGDEYTINYFLQNIEIVKLICVNGKFHVYYRD